MIVDGIDGSGKGTVVGYLKQALSARGMKAVDLGALERETGAYPKREDWDGDDLIVTLEPTWAMIGLGIRQVLVKDPSYDPLTVAHAFSADREIHYREVVIPARAAGKTIVSERGISSSLAYQVSAGVSEEALLSLPGNRLALENAPDFLAIADVDPAIAIERLKARSGKTDDSYFERLPFLERLAARYRDPAFAAIFESRGTKVVRLSTAGALAETERRVDEELLPIFEL